MSRIWIDTKDLQPMGPASRRSTRPLWPGGTSEGPSRRPVNEGDSRRRLLYAHTPGQRAHACLTCTVSPRGAETAAVRRLDVSTVHYDGLLEGPSFPVNWPPAVKMALIERRVRALLDHRRDAHHACAHSYAKSRVARNFPVPRSNLRRPARAPRELQGPAAV